MLCSVEITGRPEEGRNLMSSDGPLPAQLKQACLYFPNVLRFHPRIPHDGTWEVTLQGADSPSQSLTVTSQLFLQLEEMGNKEC